MEYGPNKKRIAFAIVLFVVVSLGVFAFANSGNTDERGLNPVTGNNNQTEEPNHNEPDIEDILPEEPAVTEPTDEEPNNSGNNNQSTSPGQNNPATPSTPDTSNQAPSAPDNNNNNSGNEVEETDPVDFSTLTARIKEAEEFNDPWLADAIGEAQDIINNQSATQEEVDNALTTLELAITAYTTTLNENILKLETLIEDATNMPRFLGFPLVQNEFDKAILNAEEALENAKLIAEYEEAIKNLNEAIALYEARTELFYLANVVEDFNNENPADNTLLDFYFDELDEVMLNGSILDIQDLITRVNETIEDFNLNALEGKIENLSTFNLLSFDLN